MRAAVFKALGQPLSIEEVPDPIPGPQDVVIKVGRCGICGTDLHITEDPIFRASPGMVLGAALANFQPHLRPFADSGRQPLQEVIEARLGLRFMGFSRRMQLECNSTQLSTIAGKAG